MELYSIDKKNFRKAFFLVEIYGVLAIIISYFIARGGIYSVPLYSTGRQITMPILLLMVLISFIYMQRIRKRLGALDNVEDFEVKVQEYEKIYKARLQLLLLACVISCFLFILTARPFFFYYAILEVLIVLPYYPNAFLFKRELKNDEIILY